MHPLKQIAAFSTLSIALGCALGCAGTKERSTTTGNGGSGGIGRPPINGLTSLTVSPTTDTVILSAAAGGMLTGDKMFSATGVVNGASQDVTRQVTWTVTPMVGASVLDGLVHATAPGSFDVVARSGPYEAHGT